MIVETQIMLKLISANSELLFLLWYKKNQINFAGDNKYSINYRHDQRTTELWNRGRRIKMWVDTSKAYVLAANMLIQCQYTHNICMW